MAFSGMPTRAYQYNQKGAHAEIHAAGGRRGAAAAGHVHPEKGAASERRQAVDGLHPVGGGQTILVKGEALISGRSGFKSPLPEYAPAIDASS